MNLAKSQHTKLVHRNSSHSYIITMKHQKEKLRKQSHSPLQQQKVKYLGINLTFPSGSVVTNPSVNAGDQSSTPGPGRFPGKEMATHSSILT